MDFENCAIYCFSCADYIYDVQLDELLRLERVRVEDTLLSLQGGLKRCLYSKWVPTAEEASLIQSKTVAKAHLGLRGLRNLGSTCFMNVILQSFAHNPPLRSYFLCDLHNSSTCSLNSSKCMACQMDSIFSQFYNGEKSPIVPNSFLWTMWMSCKELVGYAQQDCHEFFIGVLDAIHSNLTVTAPHSCSCIIHEVFSGMFQSKVTCLNCKNETYANDPFLDVSLDVRPVFSPIVQAAVNAQVSHLERSSSTRFSETEYSTERDSLKRKHLDKSSSAGSTPTKFNLMETDLSVETHSLYECLDRFTHKESLSSQEYKCSRCNNIPANGRSISLGAVKQLAFKKLPLVLSLQLKRYDHMYARPHFQNGNQNMHLENQSRKISMMVKFPLELDLSHYISENIEKKNEGLEFKASFSYIYTLFSVIVHKGTLNSGHYLCYIRQSGSTAQWFRFDDDIVTIVSWNEVSQSEAYMCFYIKKKFEYFSE